MRDPPRWSRMVSRAAQSCKRWRVAIDWSSWTEMPAPPYKRRQWARSRSSRCTDSATISSCSTAVAPSLAVDAAAARALADRRTGIGCDQVILLEPPRHPGAQVLMRIHNPDGSEAEACGNATRCVADLLRRETGDPRVRIETIAGLLEAEALPDGRVAVDMGPARTGWREIPLARADGHRTRRSDARSALCAGLHQYRQPARDLLRRRCRGDRSRGARAGPRTRPAVSAAREYRRRRDP